MAMDLSYTDGVIAARDKFLLKDKLLRLCEMTAEDAFRTLIESGFGGGAETASSVYDYEKLIEREEALVDAFIREYAPTQADAAYLLISRDFHNAKALLKAAYLGESADKLLASEGLIEISTLKRAVESSDFSALSDYPQLQKACEECAEYLRGESVSGATVGQIFQNALFSYLRIVGRKNSTLKKLVQAKADITNILTALRKKDGEENLFVAGGKLSKEALERLASDSENAAKMPAFEPYKEVIGQCLAAKEKGLPFTVGEKLLGGYETAYFAARKYDLVRNQPFLYYVLRRRAENANVRIVFALLLLGLPEHEIKKRLRGV
ncbi:MAG: V-type ATPase subunit [Clostridia bacterium]|nr:V-type ATPase subunit [Clostridia bacterium]